MATPTAEQMAYGAAYGNYYAPEIARRAAIEKRDPTLEAIDLYNNGWQMTGGGGGYDNRQKVRDMYATLRGGASTGNEETKTRLADLYNKLAQSYAGAAEQTKQRYTDAMAAGQAGSNSLIADTQARINQEAAARNAMYAQMGIGGGDSFSRSQAEAQRGMGDIGNTAANWAGLMNAQMSGQMTRDNQNYLGAKDQATVSLDDLQRRYDAYLRQLDAQEQSALMNAYSPGSGGSMVNTSGISTNLYNKLVEQGLINQGALSDPNLKTQGQLDQEWEAWKRRQDYSNSQGSGNTVPWDPMNPRGY